MTQLGLAKQIHSHGSNIMVKFKEYIKNKSKVKEDQMVAPMQPASDIVSGPKGITADDVLGKCSHEKHGGFMSKNCKHIPKPILVQPMCRLKKNKKHKIFLMTDAELNKKTVCSLFEVPEDAINSFIQKAHNEKNKVKVLAIVYYPVAKTFFAKVKCEGNTFFSTFDFDTNKKRFICVDKHKYTAEEAKEQFNKILNMPGNNPNNKGSENMQLWLVYGKL